MKRAALLVLLASACFGGSGSTAAEPKLDCWGCASESSPEPIATYSELRLVTRWYAKCWTGGQGGFPTPGDGDTSNYREGECKLVDYTPAVTCLGGTCTITPLEAKQVVPGGALRNDHAFSVVPTTPGAYELKVAYARSGKDHEETRSFQVLRPDAVDARCDAWPNGATFSVKLRHQDAVLQEGPPTIEVAVAGATCRQLERDPIQGYQLKCPEDAVSAAGVPVDVVVRGTDFEIRRQIACDPPR
jgi:hypothetical protein